MVEMRKDRFAALTPLSPNHTAQVTFKPVDLAGVCRLSLNLVVTAAAGNTTVWAELMSPGGYRLRGYDKAAAVPIVGTVDELAAPLKWAATQKLPSKDDPVIIRVFMLGPAKLFAVNLERC